MPYEWAPTDGFGGTTDFTSASTKVASSDLTLSGTRGADTLNGGTEADSLNGSDGNDIVSGSLGDDKMNGSSGDDAFRRTAAADDVW